MDEKKPQNKAFENIIDPSDTSSNAVEPGYLTLSQASAGTPYSQEYLSLLVRKGRIFGRKFGRNWHIKQQDLEAYLSTQAQKATEKYNTAPAKPEFVPSQQGDSRILAEISQNISDLNKQYHTITQSLPDVKKKPFLPLSLRQIVLTIALMGTLAAPLTMSIFGVQDQMEQLKTQFAQVLVSNHPRTPMVLAPDENIIKQIATNTFKELFSVFQSKTGIDAAPSSASTYPASAHPAPDAGSSPGQQSSGVVLGTNTEGDLVASIRSVLTDPNIQDQIRGPQGTAGPAGPTSQYIPNSGSVFGVTAPAAEHPGTIGSTTYGSSDSFVTRLLTVSSDINQTGGSTNLLNTTIAGSLNVTGASSFTGDILPNTDDTYNIGSTSSRFKSLRIGTGDSSFAGNVGIGTTAPAGNLDIRQAADGETVFYARRNTDTAPTGNFLRFQNAAGSSDLFLVDAAGNLTVNGTTTLNGLTITNSLFTSTAQSTFTKVPTLAHLFSPSWPAGTSNAADGTIYINPASSVADGNLLSAAVGGNIQFLVDAEGDVYANNLILSGSTTTGASTIAGNLTVQDNTTFGDATTDTIAFVGRVNSNVTFTIDNTNDFGASGANRPRTGYFGTSVVSPSFVGALTGNADTVTNGVYTNAANSFSLINPLTTIAESWIGPSSTTGVYFKAGNVGIGTTNPSALFSVGSTSQFQVSSAGVVTAGTYNGQTITGAANFTGTMSILGPVTIGGTAMVSNALIGAVVGGNGIEFGHSNPAGYHGTLGAQTSSGANFLAFSGEAGTTANTYRTRGVAGVVYRSDLSGGANWLTLTSSADNQAGTAIMSISSAGALGVGAITSTGALNLGTNTITSGLINGQTISSAANFTGTVTAATSVTSPIHAVTGGSQFMASAQAQNMKLKSGAAGSVGLTGYDSADTWMFQLYAAGTSYGFLNGNWAGWDIQKNVGGTMILNGSQTVFTSATSAAPNITSVGTLTSLTTSGPLYRSAAGAGYLNGQYAGVESTLTSGAIYSIGGSYVPGTTTLGNMYGIGYGYSGNAGIGATGAPASNWGMYVASGGTSRIFLGSDAGNIYINGTYYGAGTGLTGTAASLTAGTVTINTNRTDSTYYQAMWTTSGSTTLYSTNNVTIRSSAYGGIGFNASAWYIEGNASYGLYSNTGLDAAGGLWDAGNRVCSAAVCNTGSTIINTNNQFSVGGGTSYFNGNQVYCPSIACYFNWSGQGATNIGNLYGGTTLQGAAVAISGGSLALPGLPSGAANFVYFNPANNQIIQSASSRRFKNDIVDLGFFDLNKMNALRPVEFNWNEKSAMPGVHDFGLVAEEVHEIYPQLTTLDTEGKPLAVRYEMLSVLLLKNLQQLNNMSMGLGTITSGGEPLAVGDIAAIDPAGTVAGSVKLATGADQIAGVVNGVDSIRGTPTVQYVGKTRINVSEENGAINAGDKLTMSKTLPGYAAKMTESGQSIGVALEASNGQNKISALIQPGWYEINSFITSSNSQDLGKRVNLLANIIPTADYSVGLGTTDSQPINLGSTTNRFNTVFTKSHTGYATEIVKNNGAAAIQAGMLVTVTAPAEVRPRDSVPTALVRLAQPGDLAIFGIYDQKQVQNNLIDDNLYQNDYGTVVTSGSYANLQVDNSGGLIAVGDPLQLSSTNPGLAAKSDGTGTIIGIALGSLDSATGTIPVSLHISYKLQVATSNGQLTVLGSDLDAGGFALLKVKSIASASGNWSIDEMGLLTVKKIKVDVIETTKGITIMDRTNSQPYCIYVENGITKTDPGACDAQPSVVTPPAPEPSAPVTDPVVVTDPTVPAVTVPTDTGTVTTPTDTIPTTDTTAPVN